MTPSSGIITLLTDFGTVDPFVGVMKGVILRQYPTAILVDLTHDIAPQSVATGAFWLSRVTRYFPQGSVHLAVVDPTVGSTRRALVVHSDGHYFVGPDNGLLSGPLRQPGASSWELLTRPTTTRTTFHGRDLFAPAAALLSRDGPQALQLRRLNDAVIVDEPRATRRGDLVHGQVLVSDRFGNLITNIPVGEDEDIIEARTSELTFPGGRTYAEGEANESGRIAVANSWGLLELAVCGQSAAIAVGASTELGVTARLGGRRNND